MTATVHQDDLTLTGQTQPLRARQLLAAMAGEGEENFPINADMDDGFLAVVCDEHGGRAGGQNMAR